MPRKPAPTQHVWPVEGLFIQGVPHVEHDCADPFCVESGAFTPTPPAPAVQPKGEAPADPADEEAN